LDGWGYAQHHLVAFSPDGKTLAVADGRRLELWDIAKGTRLHPDDGMGGPVLAVHTHGRHVLTRDMDMNLSLWDLRTGKLQHRFSDAPRSLVKERPYNLIQEFFEWGGGYQAISPDGRTVAALWLDGPICIFDLADGKRLLSFEGSEKGTCLAFSPNGKLVAGPLADKRICLWDTTTGKRVQHLTSPINLDDRGRPTCFVALQFSLDGRTLTASTQNESDSCNVLTWELTTGNVRLAMHGRGRSTRSGYTPADLTYVEQLDNLTLSFPPRPDGKLAAAGPRAIRMLDVGGKEMRRFGGRDIAGQSAVFSPDGKYLAAGLDGGGIRIWDASTGAVYRDAPAHTAAVTSLAFAYEGKTLVSGSLDGTAIAWDFDRLLKAPAAKAASADFEKWWLALANPDGAKAAEAMQAFAAQPAETCAFFKMRLRPVPSATAKQIAQLLADLQSDQYPIRQRAMVELEKLGGQARSALEKALLANPGVEPRRRLESLLQKLEPPIAAPDLLQAIRAIEVLERIGTADARELLEELATGGPNHCVTEEVLGALQRLKKGP